MGEKTTKTVKVSASTAEKWDDYIAESPEVDSVSHLIRLAVQKELNDAYDNPRSRSDDDSQADNGEILTHLRKIETAIEDVDSRVSAIEGVKSAEANYDIEKATFNTLPEPPEGKAIDAAQERPPDFAITTEEIARQLGAEEADVQDALDHLRDTTGQIRRVTGGSENTTYYWRKGR